MPVARGIQGVLRGGLRVWSHDSTILIIVLVMVFSNSRSPLGVLLLVGPAAVVVGQDDIAHRVVLDAELGGHLVHRQVVHFPQVDDVDAVGMGDFLVVFRDPTLHLLLFHFPLYY